MSEFDLSHNKGQEITVIGVVHSRGSAGVRMKGNIWSMRFRLCVWRTPDGKLHKSDLNIRGDLIRDKLRFHMQRIKALNIISVRLRFIDELSAEFLELIDEHVDSDHELSEIAIELAKPIVFEHPRFGEFIFNRRVEWWESKVNWAGKIIQLQIPGNELEGPNQDMLQTANTLWDDQLGWEQRVSDYAVQELLPLKNDFWLAEDEASISASEFIARMRLDYITVDKIDTFVFYHDDGNLFFGHSIMIEGNLRNGLTRADIPG